MLTVLCVTRNNPVALLETYESWRKATRHDGGTEFLAVIDHDDPVLDKYLETCAETLIKYKIVPPEHTGWMNTALNYAALLRAGQGEDVGFVGDDHRFRSEGWDEVVHAALKQYAIVYGNDLWQGQNLPTQVFIRADVIMALGYFALPGARHLYLDNQWRVLGEQAGSLAFLPEVLIEHMHPSAGKGEWDENHVRVNASSMYEHDRGVFENWVQNRLQADAEIVKEVMAR
jgi:hypothetical protein